MGALIPIEPDHLVSLITLNASEREPWAAFVGGAKWGIGHSLGMIAFCLIFLPLQSLIHMSVWEHYGNYVAGMLLVGIGIYFFVNESRYLEIADDGSWVPRQDACGCCHGHAAQHSHNHGRPTDETGSTLDPESEEAPLLKPGAKTSHPAEKSQFALLGDLKGALIGLVQGLCCPSCIAGMAFVGQMGVQHPSGLDIACFFIMFLLSLVICSGLVSSSIVVVGKFCSSRSTLSTRTVFRFACLLSVVLGVTWMLLNACGRLHVIQYTEIIEKKLNGHGAGMMDMS